MAQTGIQDPTPFGPDFSTETWSDIAAAFNSAANASGITALPDPSAWDRVTISWGSGSSQSATFFADVDGHIGTKLDKKKGMGKNGAGYGVNGLNAEPIRIKLFLFNSTDQANCQIAIVNGMSLAGAAKPIQVSYPGFSMVNLGVGPMIDLFLHRYRLPKKPQNGEPGECELEFEQFLQQTSGTVASEVNYQPFQTTGLVGPPSPPAVSPPSGSLSN